LPRTPGDHEDPACRRQADDQKSPLSDGMVEVGERRRERIVEDGRGLAKVHPVRFPILVGLAKELYRTLLPQ
jgi:hypothetical protein